MKLHQLTLRNFRNYAELTLDVTHNLNIFVGQNAQGKTNIVEAIYYGAMGRSHRSHNDSELIRWQQEQAAIQLTFSRLSVEHQLSFRFHTHKSKEIIANSHPIKPRELMGLLNVVLFSPEDLLLVKGMPALRRRFLDTELSQASPAYYQLLLKYNRIVTQRNNLLKKIRERRESAEMLEAWDAQLAVAAAKLVEKRQVAVKKLAMLANLMHRKITANQENLVVGYEVAQGETDSEFPVEWYQEKLASSRQDDIWRGSTSVGPHRDDLVLKVNQINLRTFGSQGQQRTGVLALKLAELEFIKSETGEYPLLLLDDVMSELDASRREHLLAFIKDRIQTFITATEEQYFPDWKFGRYYRVQAGAIVE